MLRNRELTIETAAGTTTRTLTEQEALAELRDTFGLQVPPGTALHVPE